MVVDWYLYAAALSCFCILVFAADTGPVILDTPVGELKGIRQTVYGTELDAFLGIPYAKPPLGKLRFKRPEPPDAWEGTLDATKMPKTCFQVPDTSFERHSGVEMWNPNTEMSEDCLYLNIYAPSNRAYGPGKLRPVMVWIYGGGFYGGSMTLDIYDGRTLAAVNDVIYVSMQYRVGSLGMLYLGTGSAPGNQGLVDQHYALQWIYNNIEAFGGDRHAVTLFGESAGAMSVSLHLVSPLSSNLFQYAIMQSGSALCRWGFESQAEATHRSKQLADALGCDSKQPTNELVACLQEVDPLEMVTEMWAHQNGYNLVTPILSTVDDYFLVEDPKISVKEGRFKATNILLGGNKDEGSYFLVYVLPYLYKRKLNNPMEVEDYMAVVEAVAHSDNPALIEAVDFEYNVPFKFQDHKRYRDLLDDMIGDSDFLCPVIEFGHRYTTANNSVYLYQFQHSTSANTWPKWMGVMHGYEIDHVFGLPLNASLNYTPDEQALAMRTMKYWTNFAKTGDPNKASQEDNGEDEWPPYTATNKEYMILNVGGPKVSRGLRDRKCTFWRELMPLLHKEIKQGSDTASSVNMAHRTNAYHQGLTILMVLTTYSLTFSLQ